MFEIRLSKSLQNRVGNAPDARLNRRKRIAQPAVLDLAVQESDEVIRHAAELVVHRGNRSAVVRNVALDNCNYLCRVALYVCRSDTVADLCYRNGLCMRRALRRINIVDSLNTAGNVGVHLNDDLICVFGVDVGGSDRCGGDNVAVFVNGGGFDYRNVDVLQEVVLDPHRHLSQRNVVIGYHTGVYRITQILVGLVRHSRFKSARPCKLAVELLTKGGSGVHRKLQLFTVPCALRKLSRNCLGISRDGESADAERHFRLYELRRFLCGHYPVVISGIPYPAQEIFMCIHVSLSPCCL